MQINPSKTISSSAVGSPLPGSSDQQATAAAIKQTLHATEDDNVHTPSTPGDQRPGKAHKPELTSAQSPHRGQPSPSIVSPPFEIPLVTLRLADRPTGKGRGSRGGRGSQQRRSKKRSQHGRALPELEGPLHDSIFIKNQHKANIGSRPEVKPSSADNPKSPLMNYATAAGLTINFDSKEYFDSNTNKSIWRCTVVLETSPQVVGIGDNTEKKGAERLSALHALYQLHDNGLVRLFNKIPKAPATRVPEQPQQVVLSDRSVVTFERARSFVDYYCNLYDFGTPEIESRYVSRRLRHRIWEAVMTVSGRNIGMGSGSNKRDAHVQCYLDVTEYLESCDPDLWKGFVGASKTGEDLGQNHPSP
ncbi:hypothetical protein HYDPIDRAFT_111824, partial [Hydnomerulius pinastri MD-312]